VQLSTELEITGNYKCSTSARWGGSASSEMQVQSASAECRDASASASAKCKSGLGCKSEMRACRSVVSLGWQPCRDQTRCALSLLELAIKDTMQYVLLEFSLQSGRRGSSVKAAVL
jgi:hypothetical protein